jgi:uncharacterized cupredoxin-like copper-binding protein
VAHVSRAPVIVVIVGAVLAVVLVFIGARLAARPAPTPDLRRPGTPEQPRQVAVIMRDYVFNPSVLYLVAGETVELHVFNAGMIEHEFVLGDEQFQQLWRAADQAPQPAPGASVPVVSVAPRADGRRVLLQPGESAAVAYTVPASDGLAVFCHLPGHAERGMVAEVVLVNR